MATELLLMRTEIMELRDFSQKEKWRCCRTSRLILSKTVVKITWTVKGVRGRLPGEEKR